MANYNCYALLPDGTPVFDRKGNPDLERGEIYISVSQILAMESAGDFLTTWLLNTFGKLDDPVASHKKYMERVSSLGTRLHRFVECDLKGIPFDLEWNVDLEPGAESWVDFRKQHKIKLVDSEKILYSQRLRVAGTRDMKLEIDDQLYIGDLKTGSVQPKAFVQLAIYSQLGHEMGEKDNEGAKLLVLGGTDSKSKISDGGAVRMHFMEDHFGRSVTQADLFAYFMCLRHVWYIKNLKSRKFQPVIKGMEEALDPMVERFKAQFHA